MGDKSVVRFMANYLSDGTMWSPKDMFMAAIDRLEEEAPGVKKAIAIFIDPDDPDPRHAIKWTQCGLSFAQMLDIITLLKNDLILGIIEANCGE